MERLALAVSTVLEIHHLVVLKVIVTTKTKESGKALSDALWDHLLTKSTRLTVEGHGLVG